MRDIRPIDEWEEYYQRFGYFTPSLIRAGNHPRVLEHAHPVDRSIVLLHGLTDSPYYMTAIGEFFHHRLGYNVYLPLLHGHGLLQPNGMEGISLDEWKKNVDFSVDFALKKAHTISLGGLSLGGTLSLYTAIHHEAVTGDLFLFSPAFDLTGGFWGISGEIKERVLRTPFAKFMERFDDDSPLVGDRPYRYTRMDKDGAIELGKLMKETDRILASFKPPEYFPYRVFVAYSESDRRIDFAGIERMQKITPADRLTLFRIPAEAGVSHASVVLREPIYGLESREQPLERENPMFGEMMEVIVEKH